MNLKLICCCTLLLSSALCSAQKETSADVTNVTKGTFLSPGISYEARIGKFQTVYLQGFMSTSAYFSYSSALGTDAGISFDPAITGQYRYYYNAGRRQSNGKRTEMNSMNYVGGIWETLFSKNGVTSSSFDEESRRPIHSFGAIWGLQRNYNSRFSLDLNLGLGYLFTKGTELNEGGRFVSVDQSMFTPLGQFTLGFWLNRRQ